MLRHLKNANELALYASLSCGAAFLGRLLPAFYFPVLLLRLGVVGYCIYVIAYTEKNKELAVIIGGSVFLGMLGGYWDLIEVYLLYNLSQIISTVTAISIFVLLGLVIYLQITNNGQASKK